ncbi:protein of unknown function [Candidatus Nitrosocaldus cavascurensis]|uniref:Uncharacterized protein n=1 Tax=Candidatus Nitrosocaldus cavascurensis TaxID=2058097 RepID=A0A2K5ARF8_9ARCH|nr:protein of unknown function [Candidatus Nitrosocaldus cavascurensis]
MNRTIVGLKEVILYAVLDVVDFMFESNYSRIERRFGYYVIHDIIIV